jgi:thioredoxin 1
MATELTDAIFEQEVIQAQEPVLVDLWAPWCGPCRMLAPIIEKIGNEYKGKAKVFKLNTDENPNTAVRYRVQAIPTLLFFKGGELVQQLVGMQAEKEIRQQLDNLLK